jgi:hypothetical protein
MFGKWIKDGKNPVKNLDLLPLSQKGVNKGKCRHARIQYGRDDIQLGGMRGGENKKAGDGTRTRDIQLGKLTFYR